MAQARRPRSLKSVLESGSVRRTVQGGRTLYDVVDVVAALAVTREPQQDWEDLKAREPQLAGVVEEVEFSVDVAADQFKSMTGDAVSFEGVLRLVQSIPSRRAERVKRWLARAARERLAEAENPELAALRTRKLYERKGHSRRWIDKRLRGMSARHELTGEWYKRGAHDGERSRTN